MNKKLRVQAALLTLVLFFTYLSPAVAEDIYEFPGNITSIGSEAFLNTSMPTGIFIPSSVTHISPDVFSDPASLTVYGFSESAAKTYAAESGAAFVPVDITSASLVAPGWASPFTPVVFTASAASGGSLTYAFTVYEGDTPIAESGETASSEFRHTFTKSGAYSAVVRIRNRYASAEAALSAPLIVAEPIRTVKDHIFLSIGESADVVSQSETRAVTIESSDDSALTVSGNTVTAVKLGTHTITLKSETPDGTIYTYVPVDVIVPPESVRISADKKRLNEGADMLFSATVMPEDADYKTVTWSVSDKAIGTIDENGRFTAKKAGAVKVYAHCANLTDEYKITVTIPVKSIEIDAAEVPETLYSGMQFPLKAVTGPENAYDPSVKWHSSNQSVAVIDSFTGIVTLTGEGEITFTATANDKGGASASLTLNVQTGVQKIVFDEAFLLRDPGDVFTPSYTISPESAKDFPLSWHSSDPSVAEAENGRVTCIAPGRCEITVTAHNGLTGKISLTVAKPVSKIESALSTVHMNPGTTLSPLDSFVFIHPSDSEHKSLVWTSDSPDIVHVDEKTGLLSAILTGSAQITGTAPGGKTVQFTVQVVSDAKVVSSASLSAVYGILGIGTTGTLTPTLAPSTKYTGGVWYSDNESVLKIVSIDSANRATVKGASAGTANLHYIATSGVSAVCPIVVNPVVAKVLTMNASSLTLNVGDAFPLAVSYQPAGATATSVSWTSSDEDIVRVDENGMILALKSGSSVITALCEDGAKATCTVTVSPLPMTHAELSVSALTLNAGDAVYAEYTYLPENATPAAFVWTSGNSRIASVEALTGKITALNPGQCLITAAALDGSGIHLSLDVTVTETPIEEFFLSTESLTLNPGEECAISTRALPTNASYASPVFASSDENVATVDESGKVCAVSDGECVITVTAGRGDYEVTETVIVTVQPVNDVAYRALIFGQFTSPDEEGYLTFANNSTKGVRDALSRSVIDGHKYAIRRLTGNPSPAAISSAIGSIAQAADENDVTVVFFLTHGSYTNEDGYTMETSSGRAIRPGEIISSLKGISGHVVLILCTCNSGRIFESAAGSSLYASQGRYQGTNGEGRLSILCASTNTLSSYYRTADESASYDFYSYAVTRGLGWNMLADGAIGRPLADANGDGKVTVSELASFTRGDTQRALSAFIQKYGTANFSGSKNQFPRWKIAEGESDLVIFSK